MDSFILAQWLGRSTPGVVGGPVFPDPLQQQALAQEAKQGAEKKIRSSVTMGKPEAPEASAGEISSGSGSESCTHEQENSEDNSFCSENSAVSSGRGRTKFSALQLWELEKSFQAQHYLGASEKRRLSRVLKLSQIQIKTWFQNRRMKFKRQVQEARVQALFSGFYHRYPEMCVPSSLSGLEYNIACLPSGTMPLHPTLPFPILMTHSYASLPHFVPNVPFQFSPAAFYQPTGQGPFLTRDYDSSHISYPFKDS